MRIGLNTDSLGYLPFDEMLDTVANLGVHTLEFCCGGWSSSPHVDLNLLIENEREAANFVAKIRDHGLEISALNCSGNQLAPGERGRSNDQVVRNTMKLAEITRHPTDRDDVRTAGRTRRSECQLDYDRLAS